MTIKIWAYKIAEIEETVGKYNWMSLDIAQNTANLLAGMFKGKTNCSTCGTVQYDDEVIIDDLSQSDQDFITRTFPFVTIRK